MGRGKHLTQDQLTIIKHAVKKGKKAVHIKKENPEMASLATLQRAVKQIKATGGYQRKQSNRVKSKRTGALVEKVRADMAECRRSTKSSVRKLAMKHKVSYSTINRVLKHDLQMMSKKPYKTFKMNATHEKKRHKWAIEMKKAISGGGGEFGIIDLGRVWFSDEKLFRIHPGGTRGAQNKRVWAYSDDDPALRVEETERFSKGVMVALAISKCGKGRLLFVQEGTKICGVTYKRMLEHEVIPDINMHMAERDNSGLWWWQQDLAPSHGQEEVKKLLADKSMVPNLFPWIPKGADCSPLDYSIWGWMDQQLAERRETKPITTDAELRTALLQIHASMPQKLIDDSIENFRKRIDLLVEKKGGHFEANLKKMKKK